jgi:hypothetical protein
MAQTTAAPNPPAKQQGASGQQQRRGPAFELLDALEAVDDDPDLNRPEDQEGDPDVAWNRRPS